MSYKPSSYQNQIPPEASATSQIDQRGIWSAKIFRRYEPRTCRKDYSQALSFEVHDPMWMLTRQWQYGRFRANDCGSLVSARVQLRYKKADGICEKQDLQTRRELPEGQPWEPMVESMETRITPFVRVESAMHLQKMIRHRFDAAKAAAVLSNMRKAYKLDDVSYREDTDNPIGEIVDSVNGARTRFLAVFAGRSFDGWKAYQDNGVSAKIQKVLSPVEADLLMQDYQAWFKSQYHPADGKEVSYWNPEKLGYDFSLTSGSQLLTAENYSTGHVGWYTFDSLPGKGKDNYVSFQSDYIPTRATFPSAPARRLWEYEDRRVHFGNLTNKDVSQLASAVMMEYISLYSNDWMIIPVDVIPGMVTEAVGVTVKDCFGGEYRIDRTPQDHDANASSIPFTDRWSLFEISKAAAFKNNDFSTERCLLFPASLLRVDESEPAEEVQFLRDEMANMLWGVEKKIDDGCGGSMSGDSMSGKVLSVVDAEKGEEVPVEDRAEFTYLIQNRVPVHWIPFLPQRIPGQFREIRFQRARMPLYYKGQFCPVRPNTSILAVHREKGKVKPLFINEEEILSYGTKVILTTQRTRWTGGKTYLWRGYAKRISGYQGNSGLMFDALQKLERPHVAAQEPESES